MRFWDIKVQLYSIGSADHLPALEVLKPIYRVILRNKKIVHVYEKDKDIKEEISFAPIYFKYKFESKYLGAYSIKANTEIHVDGYTKPNLVYLNQFQKLKLSWTFGNTFIQKWEFWKVIIPAILGFISGWILRMLTYNCN